MMVVVVVADRGSEGMRMTTNNLTVPLSPSLFVTPGTCSLEWALCVCEPVRPTCCVPTVLST